MTTPYGVPYREPCGGWVEPRREFFGGPFQHYKASETAIPLYANSFTYGETPSGPAETCEGGTIYHGNCYIDAETTQNFASCIKTGWKGVRARKAWFGRDGFGSGCDGCGECPRPDTHYLGLGKTVTHTHHEAEGGTNYFVSATRSVALGAGGARTFTCADDDADHWGIDSVMADLLAADWACGPVGFGSSWSGILLQTLLHSACADAGGSASDSATSGGVTTTVAVEITTRTETSIAFSVTVTNSSDPDYYDTWTAAWDLSTPYTLAECIADAVAMVNEWDLSDDVQYPWRTDGSRGLVPYVIRRETLQDVAVSNCPPGESSFLDCPIDPGVTGDSCVYDGEIVGDPLPNGYGPHYAYWSLWDSVTGLSIGWNPLGGLPATATWWTTGDETDTDSFPDWGFVICRDGFVYVQKWAQVKDVMTSVNFFRPCGADRDKVDENDASYAAAYGGGVGYCDSVADPVTYPPLLLYPAAWPICGRIAIVSKATVSGVTTVTLDEPASYLRVGDSVDMVSYGPAPDYDELTAETVTVASVAGDFLSFTY